MLENPIKHFLHWYIPSSANIQCSTVASTYVVSIFASADQGTTFPDERMGHEEMDELKIGNRPSS
jgi:hypothetical protein